MNIQKIFTGNQPIETEVQKRKIILGGYLTLMYFGIDFFFFVVNLFNPGGTPFALFLGFFVAGISLLLIRKGYIDLAIFIQLLRANAITFYFAYFDESAYQTASYIHFIPSSLGAMAIYGNKERWKGLAFTFLSAFLFLVVMTEPKKLTPDQAHFYFISNFLLVFVVGVLILAFYDQLHFDSEKKIMQQNQDLIKTNSELDSFVYSVSHNIRAPLMSVLGLIQLSKIEDFKNDTIKQYIKMMEGSVLKLDETLKEILDYSRNSRKPTHYEKIDFENLIDHIFNKLNYLDKSLVVHKSVAVDNPNSVDLITDKLRLSVMLTNIISNAIQFMDINKERCYINITASVSKEKMVIGISDNGIGINKKMVGNIFDMFYRGTEMSRGAGLGLYIVKEALSKLEGSAEVDTQLGIGTKVTLVIPNHYTS